MRRYIGHRPPLRARPRRGAALLLTMFFILALGALATSAIYLSSNATLLARSQEKEDLLRYAAEAGLAYGKARLNFDPVALPDTGVRTLLSATQLNGADGQPINGAKVSVYLGPTGSTSGQFGRFASVVAEARDPQGNGVVRRLELSQESFAKFAYWSNSETNNGSPIYFGGNDQIWGPVWSNDNISLLSTGATFHADVGTAGVINGAGYGKFLKGYRTRQKAIGLPPTSALTKLSGYAVSGHESFTAPTSGDETSVRMRIEFVAVDLDGDGDSTGVDEGFLKVYTATTNNQGWLRGDWLAGSPPAVASVVNCGDWHAVAPGGDLKFFPASVHAAAWFPNVVAPGMPGATATQQLANAQAEGAASLATIMQHPNARCFAGGDPHLVAVSRSATSYPDTLARYKGGDDTTFTATDPRGAWQPSAVTPPAALVARRPWDAAYLIPLYRGYNSGTQGVVYVDGTTGVSGVLRGRVTLYATGTVVVLDDLRYADDPASGVCADMLGLIAGNNVVVADNALNTPQKVRTSPALTKSLDDTKDLYVQAVIMALNTSFAVENYAGGPTNVNGCEGTANGRGCLYLTGGLIQYNRGAVGTSNGTGFTKRYSYDRCAVASPPPYFPTTGRFTDIRYYELDPVKFDVQTLYKSLTPAP